jgi:serine/threonine-protein kinase
VKLDVTALPPGLVLLGKYRVIGTIGVGGMGVVISAEHLQLHSKVAVKFMLPALVAHASVVKRFVNEARAASRIQSEHVARVLDVGSMTGEGLPDDGVPYMVMEYLQGRDLSQLVRSGKRLPVHEAVDFVVQASEALAQAHKVGIIHRDIKPANLFLADYEGRKVVKVLDFGISKILDEEPNEMNLTKTTTVLGSGLYMSPEQMRSAKNVDFRTDIYSLGVCLYELLAGTQPFTAETFSELVVKVNIDPPTPLKQYRPDISDEFATALEKAYARKPEDRYQSIQEMVSALGAFAAEGSATAIRQVQGITMAAPVPGARGPLGSQDGALGRTAGALSASGEREGKAGRSRSLLAVGGVAAVVGVVGAIVALKPGAAPAPASTTTAATTTAVEALTAAPSASARPTAEPVSPASAVESAEAPAGSATASASATATSSVGAPPVGRPTAPGVAGKPSTTPTASPATPPPPKCVQKRDPVTGLLVPCL